MSVAVAQPVLGIEPDPATAPILYVEAEASCPFSRSWVTALMAVPDPGAAVVVVTPDPLEPWRGLASERGWTDLVVVSDPDGARAADLFRGDGRLGTTTVWRYGERVVSWTPSRVGDPPWTQALAFVADPEHRIEDVPRFTAVELVLFAEDGLAQARRAARYLRRKDEHPHADLEVATTLQRWSDKDRDQRLAEQLLARAAERFPDDEAVLAATTDPEPAVGELSAEQLQAAVRRLDGLVRAYYSGIVVADEAVGGWEDHVARVLDHAAAKPSWGWRDAAGWLVDEVLAPIDDAHFSVSGPHPDGDGSFQRWVATDGIAWFTDLVVDADGIVVAGPEGWVGESVDVPVLPATPAETVLDTPYRYPSIAADGQAVWLVGLFAPDEPEGLELDGGSLPVHGSRAALASSGEEPWSVDEAAPIPTLAVRTMAPARLAGMAETAPQLRNHPELVLDLRRNMGGSDQPGMDWIAGLHPGPYAGPHLAYKRAAGWYPLPPSGTWSGSAAPYEGTLYVLTDKNTCSSGETFTMLAAQVPRALHVGDNTAGCLTQGNVRVAGTLPYLGLAVSFGTSAFHGDPLPGREAWGYFPDLWLDVPDPVGFLAGLPDGAVRAASGR